MRSDYKVSITDSLFDPGWDAFVSSIVGGHHVQTSCWARIKSSLGWDTARVIVTDGNDIVGGAQILLRSRPLVGKIAYITKGPICANECPKLAQKLMQKIINFIQQNRCQFLAIQPPNNGGWMCNTIESFDFSKSSLEMAPAASLLIDLSIGSESIMNQMKRETRRNIRRSERAGVIVHEGTQSDLDLFYPLYLATAKRQGFVPYEREYFDMLWQSFASRGWIALLIAYYENKAVSAQLLIPFGDTVIAKMCGWSGAYSKVYPNNALFWAAILWSAKRGYNFFDFEGLNLEGSTMVLSNKKLPKEPRFSQDAIKYGHGGNIVHYPPAYSFIPNKAFSFAFKCIQPTIQSNALASRFFEYLRKR